MDRGWIKTHRKIRDNIFLMKDNNAYIVFTKLLIFVDANGQWAGGKHQLADAVNIPAGTLYEVLRRLEQNGMITIASNHKYSVYKICKWSQYQKNSANTLQFDVKTTRQPQNVPNRQKANRTIGKNGKNPTANPTAQQQIENDHYPTTNPTVTQPRANREPTVSQHSYKNKNKNKNKNKKEVSKIETELAAKELAARTRKPSAVTMLSVPEMTRIKLREKGLKV